MVFSSVPLYLNPSSWNQHLNLHQGSISSDHRNPQQLPSFPPPPHVGGGGCGGGGSDGPGGGGANCSNRPASMVDRARLAKIPQPDTALKCPRCESTNTKFCYFNNYSLSQPRHFCKTCRRYWTRGGALRNVPVGGGCRRNKKNKNKSSSSSSKSQASAEKLAAAGSNSASATCSQDLPQQPPQLPFLASSLQNLTQYNSGNIGLNFGGIPANQMGFQIGRNSGQNIGVLDQWRSQQFPFLAADFDGSDTGLCSLQSEGVAAAAPSVVGFGDSQLRSCSTPISRVSTQMAPVKMEESKGIYLSRPILGVPENNNQYLGGYTWTDLSDLNSSSTSHIF